MVVREALSVVGRGSRFALRLPVELGHLASDVSVQVLETARAAGLPLPTSHVQRLRDREHRREVRHHETTAAMLSSLFLKATVQRRRGEPYAVDPDLAGKILADFCEETDTEVGSVLDPHAAAVVTDYLENGRNDADK